MYDGMDLDLKIFLKIVKVLFNGLGDFHSQFDNNMTVLPPPPPQKRKKKKKK